MARGNSWTWHHPECEFSHCEDAVVLVEAADRTTDIVCSGRYVINFCRHHMLRRLTGILLAKGTYISACRYHDGRGLSAWWAALHSIWTCYFQNNSRADGSWGSSRAWRLPAMEFIVMIQYICWSYSSHLQTIDSNMPIPWLLIGWISVRITPNFNIARNEVQFVSNR